MLTTETRNKNTYDIANKSTIDILKIMNQENKNVITAIDNALPQIQAACELVTQTVKNNGRVFYIGAGTSGRLGVCDAAECPPTFGVSPDMFIGIIAGGKECMFKAAENAEDNPDLAVEDLKAYNLCEKDIVIGISASGSASYVVSGILYAKSINAKTVSIANNQETYLGDKADVNIAAVTGPEVITGSTRMKAGTAQKIILNMISTTAMIQCGYVYENLMINLRPTNKKLRERMIGIVSEIIGCSRNEAEERLIKADFVIREAIK